ncbi:MAG: hypothetical protein P8J17_03150 [Halioglobus sp.]|nr:hypothetical protein [Halioglobus sp.]
MICKESSSWFNLRRFARKWLDDDLAVLLDVVQRTGGLRVYVEGLPGI